MNIWEKECSRQRKQRKGLNARLGLACSEEQQQGACVAGTERVGVGDGRRLRASWHLTLSHYDNFGPHNGITDWFQIGKGVRQGCILSPCLFNLYAEYIMGNAGLEEAQAGIKIAGRNVNNLIYADDTTLMAESEEELKGLFFCFAYRVIITIFLNSIYMC